jgi:hypothetical protein
VLRSAVIVGRAFAGTVVAGDVAAQPWRTRQLEPEEIVASGLHMRVFDRMAALRSSGQRRFRNVRGRAAVDYS